MFTKMELKFNLDCCLVQITETSKGSKSASLIKVRTFLPANWSSAASNHDTQNAQAEILHIKGAHDDNNSFLHSRAIYKNAHSTFCHSGGLADTEKKK